jgi:biotin operon repressor
MSAFAGVKAGSQNERILSALASGQWMTTAGIHRKAGMSRLNSRISELRRRGFRIEHERVNGPTETRSHRYRWLDAPGVPLAVDEFRLSSDDISPRTDAERFRVYSVGRGDDKRLEASGPDAESIGLALFTLAREGRLDNRCVGVYDVFGGKHGTGGWLVNPYVGSAW